MPTIEIGCGQITWSNDTPEDQVLAEIAQAGYAGAPAVLSTGRTAGQAQAVFARRGLKPAPGYLGVDFWRADQHDSILERAREYAINLGVALQLTNILRDLDEDAGRGRLYLPREVLDRHGIRVTYPKAVLRHPALSAVCR